MTDPRDSKAPGTTRLRADAETQLAQTAGAGIPAHPVEALVHELQVHRIELEMQNEALRQIQGELEESRDRYVNLYEYAPVGYLTVSAAGLITDINLTGVGFLGEQRPKLLQRRFEHFVVPAQRLLWADWFAQSRQLLAGQGIDLDLQRADGSIFPAQLESRTLLMGEQLPVTRITLSDISARKMAENVLAEYKAHLEDLVASRTADLRAKEARIAHFSRLTATLSEINRAIVFNSSLDEVFASACRACVTLGAYKLAWVGRVDAERGRITVSQSYGLGLDFLDGLDIDTRAEHPLGPSAIAFREQRTYICNDFSSDPATLPWRDKARHYGVNSCISLPINYEGVPQGVLTAYGEQPDSFDEDAERVLEEIAHSLSFAIRHFADAAAQQQSAAALRESEALLQEAQKVAALGHWAYLVDSGTIRCSPQVYRLFGQEPAGQMTDVDSLVRCYLPESAERLKASVSRAVATGERVELELQLELPGGQIAHHAFAIIPRGDEQGEIRSLYGTIQDISEHKRTEEKLIRQASQLLDAANEVADLYQNAPCGYHSLDKDGVFCQINDTELRWLGYTHAELVGKKSILELLTPGSRQTFHANWPRFMNDGVLRDLEMELVRRDGTLLPVLVSATAIRDALGKFLMSRSTVYDMTERRKMEFERADYARRVEALSRHLVAVQEAGRRQLSGALHDRTSPNLAAIDINFRLIARELPEENFPGLAARLEDTRALIKDTSASIREICADLRPPVLDYAGLPAALETYAQQFAARTGITVNARCTDTSRRLAPDIESLLFRIAQESLTNCAKHAHAAVVDLRLNNQDSPVVLEIADDGDGFVLDALGHDGRECGLGILNMREMAEFAGGKFTIVTHPGQGTRITVEIP